MSLLIKAVRNPKRTVRRLLLNVKADRLANGLIDGLKRGKQTSLHLQDPVRTPIELLEIQRHALERTDISEHLVSLFAESLTLKPRLIVELGVRNGQSTFAFERAARLCKAALVSVDIQPVNFNCAYPSWYFIQEDDVKLASYFIEWCRDHGLPEQIDLLFIDTSHLFEHTCQEIATWFPLLAGHAKAIFHDTNDRLIFRRSDGSIGIAWDNHRGVIAAIEQFLGVKYNERCPFSGVQQGWYIRHTPTSCGLTVLERL